MVPRIKAVRVERLSLNCRLSFDVLRCFWIAACDDRLIVLYRRVDKMFIFEFAGLKSVTPQRIANNKDICVGQMLEILYLDDSGATSRLSRASSVTITRIV